MTTDRPTVAVVGAGLAGLAAAAALRDRGVAATVLEREAGVGGRVKTVVVDGAAVDVGAQSIAPFGAGMLATARALGLGDDLTDRSQRMAVVRDGVRWPIDSPRAVASSGLLPVRSRLRAARLLAPLTRWWSILDPIDLSRAAAIDDVSASGLLARWGDEEIASNLVAPLLRALLYWDLPTTSQVPLLATLKAGRRGNTPFRLRGGMGRLTDALASTLDVRTGCRVTRVEPRGSRYAVATERADAASETLYDGVVCATTASAAAAIVAGAAPETASFLASVGYSRTRVFGFHLPDGVGGPRCPLTFPAPAGDLLASVNPPWRSAPAGVARVVRAHLSDAGFAALEHLDDAEAAERVLAAVAAAGVDDDWVEPARLAYAWSWSEALPRFPVGHLSSAPLRDPATLDAGTLVFAGDYLLAPHVEGALQSGRRAAERLAARLGGRRA